MREIKFRAWFELEKKMIEPANLGLQYEGDEEQPFTFAFDKSDLIERENGEVHEKGTLCFKLMQYTGLKDKEGKEIYEGDIVKVPVEMNNRLHGDYAYHEIKYRNGLWITSYVSSEKGFILPRDYLVGELIDFAKEMRKSLVFNEYDATFEHVEVIGNIYENPELLGGASE